MARGGGQLLLMATKRGGQRIGHHRVTALLQWSGCTDGTQEEDRIAVVRAQSGWRRTEVVREAGRRQNAAGSD